MTPQETANAMLGRGPQTVRDVAAQLLRDGWSPETVLDQARICLTYLVNVRKAERVEVMGVSVYRLCASVPFEKKPEQRP